MTENIVTGMKYRILTDEASDIWDRISLWTKASDVVYNDNSTAEDNKPVNILKRGTYYQKDTIAYEITAPSWVMLKCTRSGITSTTTPPEYSSISSLPREIEDGGAMFAVYDVRVSSTLSSSQYQIPAMSLVDSLNSQLTTTVDATSQSFYFDYHDGKYGFNTSSSRGIETFSPFGESESCVTVKSGASKKTGDQSSSGTFETWTFDSDGYFYYSLKMFGEAPGSYIRCNLDNGAFYPAGTTAKVTYHYEADEWNDSIQYVWTLIHEKR